MIRFNAKKFDGYTFDILCRTYRNQDPDYWRNPLRDVNEQICVEVMFSARLNMDPNIFRATCEFPRGAAAFIAQHIKPYKGKDMKIAINNELYETVGVLTSCREHFDKRMRQEIDAMTKQKK
jgi:hypothetical protein